MNTRALGAALLLSATVLSDPVLNRLGVPSAPPDVTALWRLLCSLAGAAGLWLALGRSASRLGAFYRSSAVICLNVVVLFAVANIIAALLDRPEPQPLFYRSPQQMLKRDPEFMRARYPGRSLEEIRALLSPPARASHPTLEFIQRPTRSTFYNVGFAGVRGSMSNAEIRKGLHGGVWVFGGSTLFGHGIADDQTIPHHLGALDPTNRYLNFGVQGAHQNLELEKLILLLKKGHRPSRVLFVDGLNDMLSMLGSSFLPEETPMMAESAYGHLYTIRHFYQRRSFSQLLADLPLTRALRARPKLKSAGFTRLDEAQALYFLDPRAHYESAPKILDHRLGSIEHHQAKLLRYYRANLDQLAALGRAYGFSSRVFFQPVGLLNHRSPFLTSASEWKQSSLHQQLSAMSRTIRAELGAEKLPGMVDITDADQDCADCYVDLAHYDGQLCRKLAQRMLSSIRTPPPTSTAPP